MIISTLNSQLWQRFIAGRLLSDATSIEAYILRGLLKQSAHFRETLQDVTHGRQFVGRDAPMLPDEPAIDGDRGIDDVPADLTRRVGAAGMEMQEARIPKCAAAPAFVVLDGRHPIRAARMNAGVPRVDEIGINVEPACNELVVAPRLRDDARAAAIVFASRLPSSSTNSVLSSGR